MIDVDLPGRSVWKHRFVPIGIALIVALGAGYWWYTLGDGQLHYVTAPATRGDVAPYVTSSGTVNPVTTIQVGSYVSGVINELHCDFNTKVHKGQLCAKIDPRPYLTVIDQAKANLAQAEAQLGKDRANLAFTKEVYDRDLNLLERGIISQETSDTAKNAFLQAQAQIALDEATIKQHQAVVSSAQVNLDYTNIISPVDGTVVSRNITQGQTVAASFQTPTLFLIATDLTKMQVDTNVSESDIGGVSEGNEASFRVEAYPDHPFIGKVVQVRQAPQSVQNVVTYDVVIGVDNPELLLKPGMTAATRIVIQRHNNVMRVPNQALRYFPGGLSAAKNPKEAQVWVLRDGKPVRVPVVTGLEDDTYTEIAKGELAVDDPVVITERVDKGSSSSPGGNQTGPRLPRV